MQYSLIQHGIDVNNVERLNLAFERGQYTNILDSVTRINPRMMLVRSTLESPDSLGKYLAELLSRYGVSTYEIIPVRRLDDVTMTLVVRSGAVSEVISRLAGYNGGVYYDVSEVQGRRSICISALVPIAELAEIISAIQLIVVDPETLEIDVRNDDDGVSSTFNKIHGPVLVSLGHFGKRLRSGRIYSTTTELIEDRLNELTYLTVGEISFPCSNKQDGHAGLLRRMSEIDTQRGLGILLTWWKSTDEQYYGVVYPSSEWSKILNTLDDRTPHLGIRCIAMIDKEKKHEITQLHAFDYVIPGDRDLPVSDSDDDTLKKFDCQLDAHIEPTSSENDEKAEPVNQPPSAIRLGISEEAIRKHVADTTVHYTKPGVEDRVAVMDVVLGQFGVPDASGKVYEAPPLDKLKANMDLLMGQDLGEISPPSKQVRSPIAYPHVLPHLSIGKLTSWNYDESNRALSARIVPSDLLLNTMANNGVIEPKFHIRATGTPVETPAGVSIGDLQLLAFDYAAPDPSQDIDDVVVDSVCINPRFVVAPDNKVALMVDGSSNLEPKSLLVFGQAGWVDKTVDILYGIHHTGDTDEDKTILTALKPAFIRYQKESAASGPVPIKRFNAPIGQKYNLILTASTDGYWLEIHDESSMLYSNRTDNVNGMLNDIWESRCTCTGAYARDTWNDIYVFLSRFPQDAWAQ